MDPLHQMAVDHMNELHYCGLQHEACPLAKYTASEADVV